MCHVMIERYSTSTFGGSTFRVFSALKYQYSPIYCNDFTKLDSAEQKWDERTEIILSSEIERTNNMHHATNCYRKKSFPDRKEKKNKSISRGISSIIISLFITQLVPIDITDIFLVWNILRVNPSIIRISNIDYLKIIEWETIERVVWPHEIRNSLIVSFF